MQFRISDTFTDSLARLTAQEQKAVKTTAFDLQVDPSAPGLSFHRLDRARDTNFWSVRVSADLRLIVHRAGDSLLLAYVGHHDAAYAWAARRKIERHPTTGAMQLVEVLDAAEAATDASRRWASPDPREKFRYEQSPTPLFILRNVSDPELLSYGVPPDWLAAVKTTTEATLFDILSHLPQEAQEALLKLAVGETPDPPSPAAPEADPFAHPDAQRRFRVLTNVEELRRALDYPWDKWAVFLHPSQSALVERAFSGPARISGSAGTGKTIVALHRAVHLARTRPDARILLTTFSKPLANALRQKLASLVASEPQIGARITVKAITGVGYDLYAERFGQPQIAASALIRSLLAKAAGQVEGHKFSANFLFGEWSDVVDAWRLTTWEDYAAVTRLGRKTRIGGKQREMLWAIFARVCAGLAERNVVTWADVFGRLAERAPSLSTTQLWTSARIWAWPRRAFWASSRVASRKACSSPATWGSGFSNSPSRGRRWASTCAAAPPRCASITAHPTRSVCTPIACSPPACPMWMAWSRVGAAQSPCSTALRRR